MRHLLVTFVVYAILFTRRFRQRVGRWSVSCLFAACTYLYYSPLQVLPLNGRAWAAIYAVGIPSRLQRMRYLEVLCVASRSFFFVSPSRADDTLVMLQSAQVIIWKAWFVVICFRITSNLDMYIMQIWLVRAARWLLRATYALCHHPTFNNKVAGMMVMRSYFHTYRGVSQETRAFSWSMPKDLTLKA